MLHLSQISKKDSLCINLCSGFLRDALYKKLPALVKLKNTQVVQICLG